MAGLRIVQKLIILDFDRMHYIYPEFDISRAILSGAILENNINLESTKAFVVGYRESSPLTVAKRGWGLPLLLSSVTRLSAAVPGARELPRFLAEARHSGSPGG